MSRALIDHALLNSGCDDRYNRRKRQYPTLAQYAQLPSDIAAVSDDTLPWCCHGLAFRMATYSDVCEEMFDSWDSLLKFAITTPGWNSEYSNWNNNGDHWAIKWDKFYHFVWLLQCREYFSQNGLKVSFSGHSAPDLFVEDVVRKIYVECTFYQKWWMREAYLEDVLGLIDPNLSIRRTHNIAHPKQSNPFSSDDSFSKALNVVASALAPKQLAAVTAAASITSPQTICVLGNSNFSILLKGNGEYQPDLNNAHGDPALSLPTFISEIIKAKDFENNLKNSHPNIVLVNALGIDFQLSNPTDQFSADELKSQNIDELWIVCCDINDRLATCRHIKKLKRHDYPGWGM